VYKRQILNCAEHPDVDLACRYIGDLVDQRRAHPDALPAAAMAMAKAFSSKNMMKNFRAICHAPVTKDSPAPTHIAQLAMLVVTPEMQGAV
jgi:hypothetical protein